MEIATTSTNSAEVPSIPIMSIATTWTNTGEVPSIPIMSIDDIMNTIDAIKSKEGIDRDVITGFLNINIDDLRARLVAWGSVGCPENYTLYILQFVVPDKCSDGIVRGFLDYVSYLNPDFSIGSTLLSLESRLPGMLLTYSYTNTQSICVHISRK